MSVSEGVEQTVCTHSLCINVCGCVCLCVQAARVLGAGVSALQGAGVSGHLQLRGEQDGRRNRRVRSRTCRWSGL